MSAAHVKPVPLVPRRRFAGDEFGRRRSTRRGDGDEIVGTRPYRPGDRIARIQWSASARLSAARGADEFVVREFFAEHAPGVVVVLDTSPELAINPEPSPWLDKRLAAANIARLLTASAAAEQAEITYAEPGRGPVRLGSRTGSLDRLLNRPRAPRPATLAATLASIADRDTLLPAGSFVFVVSDFVAPIAAERWGRLRARRFDVTPVIVQDPVWEQTFPGVGGVVLGVVDAQTGRAHDVLLRRREAAQRAAENERRLDDLIGRLRRLGFDPLVVGSSDPAEIRDVFLAWAERRRRARRLGV